MKKRCPKISSIGLLLLSILFLGHGTGIFAQGLDTVRLKEVSINAYLSERPVLRLPSSVNIIDSAALRLHSEQSLVSAMNTSAGVRMEERSPGSYRLSIRGSLLRSPFGIRNVKVYLDDFPLTDGGGNTYLNLLDPGLVQRIEILKGPDGSLFGANSGGVVRLDIVNDHNDSNQVKAAINGGSFGMVHQYASVQRKIKNNILSVGEGYQHSDGYRENSSLERKYIHVVNRWKYAENSQLRFLFFYSSLAYRTPGGLTLEQFNADPTAARPPTSVFPGAVEQKAGVYNRTVYSGLLSRMALTKNVSFVNAFWGSYTDFENPFITNYEVRKEASSGLRSWIEVRHGINDNLKLKWDLGGEVQRTGSEISNYGNRSGKMDSIQAKNIFDVMNGFVFLRGNADLNNKLQLEASCSYNFNQYLYENIFPDTGSNSRVFSPQLMPRLAVSYLQNPSLAWRAVVSKGYSPPTLAEVLSSGNVLNKELDPESGYNYEAGVRFRTHDGRLWLDISAFYYRLENAIVRRADDGGNEFFTNAGSTDQQGIESQVAYDLIEKNNSMFIRHLQLRNGCTVYRFLFDDYEMEAENYSGNRITGVPDRTFVSAMNIVFPKEFSVFIQHNYTSSIPLNDANSDFAEEYHLLQAKVGWRYSFKKTVLRIYIGADNILDTHYSLGNDLNAAGKRYYNAAPARNFFAGVSFVF